MIWSLLMRPKANEGLVRLRATNQAHVNVMFSGRGAHMAEIVLRELIEVEQGSEKHYGHHDWVLGQASATVACRGTVYAEPGDIVPLTQDIAGVVSFYSVREAGLFVAGAGIRPLVGWDEAFAYWRRQEGKSEAAWFVEGPEIEVTIATTPEDWNFPKEED
jgi:hypothetical protein